MAMVSTLNCVQPLNQATWHHVSEHSVPMFLVPAAVLGTYRSSQLRYHKKSSSMTNMANSRQVRFDGVTLMSQMLSTTCWSG